MLGKALLNLDEVARVLDPHFDPNAAIEAEAAELTRQQAPAAVAHPANVMAAAMEAKEFAERLPGRVNKVMDALAEGQLTLNVQGIDEQATSCAASRSSRTGSRPAWLWPSLVIGAALIMRIPTRTQIFGYPALAIVLFLLAAGAALFLLINILRGATSRNGVADPGARSDSLLSYEASSASRVRTFAGSTSRAARSSAAGSGRSQDNSARRRCRDCGRRVLRSRAISCTLRRMTELAPEVSAARKRRRFTRDGTSRSMSTPIDASAA